MEKIWCEIQEKPILERDCLYNKGLTQTNSKTCLQCLYKENGVSRVSKVQNPPQGSPKTPKALANAYLNGKSIFQDSSFPNAILQKTAHNAGLETDEAKKFFDAFLDPFKQVARTSTLQSLARSVYGDQSKYSVTQNLINLKLPPSIEKRIDTALADFTLALSMAKGEKIKNKISGKKRFDIGKAILHLKRARENVPDRQRGQVQEILNEITPLEDVTPRYSQMSEIDCALKLLRGRRCLMLLESIDKIFSSHKNKIFESERLDTKPGGPPYAIPIPGEMERNSAKLTFLTEAESKLRDLILQELEQLEDSLSAMDYMKMKQGQPGKQLIQATLIVIHRLLTEKGKNRVEKTKKHTAEIVKEYLIKRGFTEFANLKPKDVENALDS